MSVYIKPSAIQDASIAESKLSLTPAQAATLNSGLTDAATDNKTYGRKNGTWTEIQTSASSPWASGAGYGSAIMQNGGCQAAGTFGIATGTGSHADGDYSSAFGLGAKSPGAYSHAEGNLSYSGGQSSHAEGDATHSDGQSSHAEGVGTETTNTAEHAEGKYNASHTNTISSIGIGTSVSNRKNAFEVMNNGDIYMYGIGGYNGTNPSVAASVKTVMDNTGKLYLHRVKMSYSEQHGAQSQTEISFNFISNISTEVTVDWFSETGGGPLSLIARQPINTIYIYKHNGSDINKLYFVYDASAADNLFETVACDGTTTKQIVLDKNYIWPYSILDAVHSISLDY